MTAPDPRNVFEGLPVRVDPKKTPKGQVSISIQGVWFHDEADMAVTLDAWREQGMKDVSP